MQKKKIRLEIRLSEEEARVFQNKAESYGGNVSAMVRDAVRRFDDKRTRGKLMAMEGLLQYTKNINNNYHGSVVTLTSVCTGRMSWR